MTETICVGAIAGAFGVHGEVRLKSFTADPYAISDYDPLTTEDGSRTFEVQILREIKNGFAAEVSGVTTKEQADALRGVRLLLRATGCPTFPMMNIIMPI